jgi:hypothetical protein
MCLKAAIFLSHHNETLVRNIETNKIAIVTKVTCGASEQPGLGPHPIPFSVFIIRAMITVRVRPTSSVFYSRRSIIERMVRARVNIPETKIETH